MAKCANIEDVEVNVLYMMSLTMDIMIRDLDRRMKMRANREGVIGGFRQDKKLLFRKFVDSVKAACSYAELLGDDVIANTEKSNFKDLDIWQREANELARLILLYADKSSEEGAMESIFGYLNSFRGAGIVNENNLKPFYLK